MTAETNLVTEFLIVAGRTCGRDVTFKHEEYVREMCGMYITDQLLAEDYRGCA